MSIRLRGFPGLDPGAVRSTFGGFITANKFNHCHWRVVTMAETGLENAGITPAAILVTRADDLEQLFDLLFVAGAGNRQPT